MTTQETLQEIMSAILNQETNEVVALINQSIKENISAKEILDVALMTAIKRVAKKFQGADFCIPDVLLATYNINAALFTLKPYTERPTPRNNEKKQKIVIGTVEGDIHDIGKNLVSLFLKLEGFHVIDLGVDIKPLQFIEAIKTYEPEILGMSALLTTTVAEIANVINYVEKYNLHNRIKILVGGGAVTRDFAMSIGADAYSVDALSAVKTAKTLIRTT